MFGTMLMDYSKFGQYEGNEDAKPFVCTQVLDLDFIDNQLEVFMMYMIVQDMGELDIEQILISNGQVLDSAETTGYPIDFLNGFFAKAEKWNWY